MIIPITASPRSRSSDTSRCGCAESVRLAGIALSPPIGVRDVTDHAAVVKVLADLPHHHPGTPRAGQLGLSLQRRQPVVRDVAAPAAALSGDIEAELVLAELRADVGETPSLAEASEAAPIKGHSKRE